MNQLEKGKSPHYEGIFIKRRKNMKIAIIYKSITGNTEFLAKTIKETILENWKENVEIVYYGEPEEKVMETIEADLYIVGSWTDKGMCCKEIAEFLGKIEQKKIIYFGTAGFGGSQEYYDALFARVKQIVPASNEIMGKFFCQGKMPMSVRERYVALLHANPEDKKLEVSVKNFDEALSHPNEEDCSHLKKWIEEMMEACK